MRDGGERLSFTIGKSNFSITENLSGKSAVFSSGRFVSFTLNQESLLQKIHSIQEALMSYPTKHSVVSNLFSKNGTRTKQLTIVECGHYTWRISVGNKKAVIRKGCVKVEAGFKLDLVLRKINQIYAAVISYTKPLNPRYDIVRRIADAKLLVWVHDGHTVVVFEKDVDGCTMSNCLVDQQYYPLLTVGVSKAANIASLFTLDLEEVISFPVDESILRYYQDAEEMWKEM